jgi:hypothetical protein
MKYPLDFRTGNRIHVRGQLKLNFIRQVFMAFQTGSLKHNGWKTSRFPGWNKKGPACPSIVGHHIGPVLRITVVAMLKRSTR